MLSFGARITKDETGNKTAIFQANTMPSKIAAHAKTNRFVSTRGIPKRRTQRLCWGTNLKGN